MITIPNTLTDRKAHLIQTLTGISTGSIILPAPYAGLCWNIRRLCSFRLGGWMKFEPEAYELLAGWQYFSGHLAYPIASAGSNSPKDEYTKHIKSNSPLWNRYTTYGCRRFNLAGYLTKQLVDIPASKLSSYFK